MSDDRTFQDAKRLYLSWLDYNSKRRSQILDLLAQVLMLRNLPLRVAAAECPR
jgi:hypothetical protein